MRLEGLQSWMQGCIVRDEGLDAAARWIKPSARMAPAERLDIYRGMYEARLVEALRVDYPALERFLGEEIFGELAEMYVRAHPSRSYTLNRLGDGLPGFVEKVEGLRQPGFVRALAELELAETMVFDGEPGAIQVVELAYPAHVYMEAVRGGGALPAMRPRRTRLAVYRRGYAVCFLELRARPFAVLSGLLRGEGLAALERASEAEIFGWFREWSEAGMEGLASLDLGGAEDRGR